jgi:hypothetical protein
MGASKIKKQKQAANPPLLHQWFAEDSARYINDHNAECKDPACTDWLALPAKEKLVAMVKSGDTKTLYIAPYGTGTSRDYQPILALQLATGEEIAGSFDKDGKVRCQVTGSEGSICLTLLCHRKGIVLVTHKDAPDTISVLCADPECRNPFKSEGVNGLKMKLANQPVTQYPHGFCNEHGIQLRYVVCCHVLNGEEPMILGRPIVSGNPDDDLHGTALCSNACEKIYEEAKENNGMRVVCAAHLNDALGGKLELYHAEAEVAVTR